MEIKISILIPIFNRIEITKSGLRLLFTSLKNYSDTNSHFLKFEVIVIDDGSTDGSSQWIAQNYPNINILKGDGNLWWSGAINLGAKYAFEMLHADYILLWNNDIVPSQDYFIELDKMIVINKSDVLGAYIYDHDSGNIWSKGGYFNVLTGKKAMLPENVAYNKFIYKWLPGMGTLVPKSVVAKIGYWDNKKFPQYYGDLDFTIRASKNGFHIKCCDNLKLYNKTQYSAIRATSLRGFLKSFFIIRSRYNIRKDILIYRKHCISPLWIFTFFKKYTAYFRQTFFTSTIS